MFEGYKLTSNYVRLRISPEVVFAFGLMSVCDGDENVGQSLESIASRHRCPSEMDAYERLLVDAMTGDATLFAREDYVEEAWRIVDPVLKAGTPVMDYEPGTWGPADAESRVCPPEGWHDPVVAAN
jgi:glucose-6-phosphate 1-dehydrogenase